jgi:hypothetical protein
MLRFANLGTTFALALALWLKNQALGVTFIQLILFELCRRTQQPSLTFCLVGAAARLACGHCSNWEMGENGQKWLRVAQYECESVLHSLLINQSITDWPCCQVLRMLLPFRLARRRTPWPTWSASSPRAPCWCWTRPKQSTCRPDQRWQIVENNNLRGYFLAQLFLALSLSGLTNIYLRKCALT